MKKRRSRTRNERLVSAKELAEMGFCEKRVLLAHLYGQQLTAEQRRIKELEKEVQTLRQEREILKRATLFFAKESQ